MGKMINDKNLLIGITGKARSGKDSVADYLVTHRPAFYKESFAGRLKAICMELFGLTEKQCYGDEKGVVDRRYGKSPRWILQYIGTDVFRDLYPDIWVENCMNRVRELTGLAAGIVIPDVRFPNEMKAVQISGGYVWKTVRVDHEGASGGIEGHASETSLDRLPDSAFDLVLSASSGQLEKLYEQASAEVDRLLHGRRE